MMELLLWCALFGGFFVFCSVLARFLAGAWEEIEKTVRRGR